MTLPEILCSNLLALSQALILSKMDAKPVNAWEMGYTGCPTYNNSDQRPQLRC